MVRPLLTITCFLLSLSVFSQELLSLDLETKLEKGAAVIFNDHGIDTLTLSSGKKIAAQNFSVEPGMFLSDDFKARFNYKDNVDIYLKSAGDGKVLFIIDKNRDQVISEDEMTTFFLSLFNRETIKLYHFEDASKDLELLLDFNIKKRNNSFELSTVDCESYTAYYTHDDNIDTITCSKNIFCNNYSVNGEYVLDGDPLTLSDGVYKVEDLDYEQDQLILKKDTSTQLHGVSKSYYLDRDTLKNAFVHHDLSYLDDRSQEYLIFHFWGTWCSPCMQKLEESDRMLQALPKDKFVVVNIAFLSRTETDRETVSEVLKDHYKGLINIIERSSERPLMKLCHANTFPSYMIVNRENKVVYNSQNEKLEVSEMINKL